MNAAIPSAHSHLPEVRCGLPTVLVVNKWSSIKVPYSRRNGAVMPAGIGLAAPRTVAVVGVVALGRELLAQPWTPHIGKIHSGSRGVDAGETGVRRARVAEIAAATAATTVRVRTVQRARKTRCATWWVHVKPARATATARDPAAAATATATRRPSEASPPSPPGLAVLPPSAPPCTEPFRAGEAPSPTLPPPPAPHHVVG